MFQRLLPRSGAESFHRLTIEAAGTLGGPGTGDDWTAAAKIRAGDDRGSLSLILIVDD